MIIDNKKNIFNILLEKVNFNPKSTIESCPGLSIAPLPEREPCETATTGEKVG